MANLWGPGSTRKTPADVKEAQDRRRAEDEKAAKEAKK